MKQRENEGQRKTNQEFGLPIYQDGNPNEFACADSIKSRFPLSKNTPIQSTKIIHSVLQQFCTCSDPGKSAKANLECYVL